MIFNKSNTGSEELRVITGNYYANNDFDKIKTDIELATEEVVRIVGSAVVKKADDTYKSDEGVDDKYKKLVPVVQLPIAILATLMMYQKNDISHEDSGRKVKLDPESEKLPWEWQLKRDDEIHLQAFYKAVDRLIAYLEENSITEWMESDKRKVAASLFIKNADEFDAQFPIDRSGRLYFILLPFIKEAQRRWIRKALGDDYQVLLAGIGLTDAQKELLEFVYPPTAHLAMSLAIRRLPLGLIPAGVVRNYTSSSQTMNASEPASLTDVRAVSDLLFNDGMTLLEELKRERNQTEVSFKILPNNSPRNKFMRL